MRSTPQTRVIATAAIVGVMTFLAGMLMLTQSRPNTTGDEPHYLVIAQSIVLDHDVDLTNDYASQERLDEAYPIGGPIESGGHAGQYRPGGPLVPIHELGLPTLIAPVLAMGGGWYAVRVMMLTLTSIAAALLTVAISRLIGGRPLAAGLAVLSVYLTVPVLPFSIQIYPEVPASALLVAALASLILAGQRRWPLVVSGTLLALVPWMHLRFTLLVLPIALALLWTALGRPRGRFPLVQGAREHLRAIIGAGAPLVVSAGAILVVHKLLYGSAAPNAAYRSDVFRYDLGFTANKAIAFSLGSLTDHWRGSMAWAPVVLLLLGSLVLVVRRAPVLGSFGILMAAIYYVVASGMAEGGGFCPPSRWTVAFMPMLAFGLAFALAGLRRAWLAWLPLLAVSLVISQSLVTNYLSLYPTFEVTNRTHEKLSTIWPVSMATRGTIVGVAGNATTGWVGQPTDEGARRTTGSEGEGLLAATGPRYLMVTDYGLRVTGTVTGTKGDVVAVVSIRESGRTLAQRSVVSDGTRNQEFVLDIPFTADYAPVFSEVFSTGAADALTVNGFSYVPVNPVVAGVRNTAVNVPQSAALLGVAALLGMMLWPSAGGRQPAASPGRRGAAGPGHGRQVPRKPASGEGEPESIADRGDAPEADGPAVGEAPIPSADRAEAAIPEELSVER